MPRAPGLQPAPVASRLRRSLLIWPMVAAALQVSSGLWRGLDEATDHTGSVGLAALAFVAIVGAVAALVVATRTARVRKVLPRVSMGSILLVVGLLLLAGVLLIGFASGLVDATFPLTPELVLAVAGLGFIACGGAWGLWCTGNLLWSEEDR